MANRLDVAECGGLLKQCNCFHCAEEMEKPGEKGRERVLASGTHRLVCLSMALARGIVDTSPSLLFAHV